MPKLTMKRPDEEEPSLLDLMFAWPEVDPAVAELLEHIDAFTAEAATSALEGEWRQMYENRLVANNLSDYLHEELNPNGV